MLGKATRPAMVFEEGPIFDDIRECIVRVECAKRGHQHV